MKNCYLLSIPFLLLGCQSKTATEQMADSTAMDSSAISISAENFGALPSAPQTSHLKFDALLQPGATVYADSTVESEAISQKQNLEPVFILAASGLRYPEESEPCNQYPRFQVKFADGFIGWVSGDQVLKATRDENTFYGSFEHHEKSYHLYTATDTGIGASDSYGLTGCNEYSLPYLLEVENNTIQFIEFTGSAEISGMTDSYGGWFSILLSEGGSATITSFDTDENEVRLNLTISYQEGGARAVIHIKETDGTFVAESSELIEE